MVDWKDLKDKISTPGDAAAALISGTAGFAVDVFLFPAGVPPGTTALVFASGGLGIKKGFDAWRNDRKAKREAHEKKWEEEKSKRGLREELEKKADALGKLLAGSTSPLAEQLRKSRLLWESKIASDEDFSTAIGNISREYAQGDQAGRAPGPVGKAL